jgi:hypothetical protein
VSSLKELLIDKSMEEEGETVKGFVDLCVP